MNTWIPCLALVLAGFAVSFTAEAQSTDCNPPASGRWEIYTVHVVCTERTLSAENVTIMYGGHLELVRSTLTLKTTFDATPAEGHYIHVGTGEVGGGQLTVHDSTIRTSNPEHRAHSLGGGGQATITESTIEEIRFIYSTGSITGKRGSLVIKDSIINCTPSSIARECLGIDIGEVTKDVEISGNIIRNVRDGVWLTNNDAKVTNNVITQCGIGIYVEGSNPRPVIEDNTISSCKWSIIKSGGCTDGFRVRNNDMPLHLPRPTEYALGFCGDGTHNWWGESPPDAGIFAPEHVTGGPMQYDPWHSQPSHPQRLPTAVIGVLPDEVAVGAQVRLDATNSLPSQAHARDIKSYQWRLDDQLLCTDDCEAVMDVVLEAAGTHTIELLVVDEWGLASRTQEEVFARAEPAHFVDFDIQPDQVTKGTPIRVEFATAGCLDPGCKMQVCTTADCHVQWTWRLNGEVQSDLTMAGVPGERVARGQSWSVEGILANVSEVLDSRTGEVSVVNAQPVIASLDTPNEVRVDEAFSVSAQASDADGDDVTFTWHIDDQVATGNEVEVAFNQEGPHEVRLVVEDGHGGIAEASTTITASLDEPPTPPDDDSPATPPDDDSTTTLPPATGTQPDGDEQDEPESRKDDDSEDAIERVAQNENTPLHFWLLLASLAVGLTVKRRL